MTASHDTLSEAMFGLPRQVRWMREHQFQALEAALVEHHSVARGVSPSALTVQNLVDLAALPNGSIIRDLVFDWNAMDELSVYFDAQCDAFGIVVQQQWIFDSQEPYIWIDAVRIDPSGTGVGSRLILHQVDRARGAGIRLLTLLAARAEHTNGYYTWTRLGFDAPLGVFRPPIVDAFEAETGRAFPEGVQTVLDLVYGFEDDIGADYWKRLGGSLDVSFNLSDGSVSRRVLELYCEDNGIRLARSW